MCRIDDGETCEVWRESRHTARIQHKCSACGSTIPKGTRYVRCFSVYAGEANTDRVCEPCDAVRQEFGDAHHIIPAASTLIETLDECVDLSEPGEGWKQPLKWARAARSIRRRASAARQQSTP